MERFFLILFLFFPFLAFAQVVCPGQPCPPGAICIPNPLCAQTIEELIDSIITFIFYVAIAIAPLMWIIAGFFLMTAAGDPKKVDTAKRIAFYTVIGFAIVILAKGIISVIKDILGG